MSLPDDHSLSPQDLAEIRKQADRVLRSASAYDRFPTPVADIIEAAHLRIETKVSLDAGFMSKIYKTVSGPIKRAVEKLVGLFDSRDQMIYLDLTVKDSKQRFVSLHETGHGFLPWQKDTYSLMEDGASELDPYTQEQFERQANAFASEVLFQVGKFEEEAKSLTFAIKTPIELAKRYGSSNYAAIRRFVSRNARACAVIVLEPPVYEVGRGHTYRTRRTIPSPTFLARYGDVLWPDIYCSNHDPLAAKLPTHFKRKFTNRCRIPSPVAGDSERFYLEAFDTTYQTFALVFPESELKAVQLAAGV